jgi:exonuclease SbcD
MRILHFADLHLGVENYGHLNPATGLSSRLEDFLSVFDEAVDYALENSVDLVLFAGDAYKSREPTPTQQREFARRINRLVTNGIAVFLLVGNHDLPSAVGKATATEIFDTLAVRNVCVSSRPDVYRIETKSGLIQVASVPWPRRSVLLSKDETKDLGFDEIKRKLEEALSRIIDSHATRLDPHLPAVLVAHVWVTGATTGSERMITIGQDHALLPGTIGNPAFDYVALGHIHKRQVLSTAPPVVYSGSLERLDFSEEADEKGFYVIDISEDMEAGKRRVDFKFHEVKARRFVTISLSVDSEDLDPTGAILGAVQQQVDELRGAIVRVQLVLPGASQGLIRDGELRHALSDAYYATVVREVKDDIRTRVGVEMVSGLTPLEALKVWMETKSITGEHAEELLKYSEKLVEG